VTITLLTYHKLLSFGRTVCHILVALRNLSLPSPHPPFSPLTPTTLSLPSYSTLPSLYPLFLSLSTLPSLPLPSPSFTPHSPFSPFTPGEFDRVHYPLPLIFENPENPNISSWKRTINRLRKQLRIRGENSGGSVGVNSDDGPNSQDEKDR
jgi:hypothetical protein